MQGTAAFHHQITDALLPQADAVFHNATAFDTAVDVLDPSSAIVQGLVRQLLLQGELLAAGFLCWPQDVHLGEGERQEAQILQQPTPDREWVGGGLSEAQIMHTAAKVSLRKRSVRKALTSRTFLTV